MEKIGRKLQRLSIRDNLAWWSQPPRDSTTTMMDDGTGNEVPTPRRNELSIGKPTTTTTKYGRYLLQRKTRDGAGVAIRKRNVEAASVRGNLEQEMDL